MDNYLKSNPFKDLIHNRRELTFFLSGILISIVVIWYLFDNINFLVGSFNSALDVKIGSQSQEVKFDLEGANQLLKSR